MNILAIDTANNFLSLALYKDQVIHTLCEDIGSKQSEFILPKINQLLTENNTKLKDLTSISYNAGPGGFTGLRIGLSVAMSLAYSLKIPLHPVNMFAMYHNALSTETNSIIALDAKLGQIYLAGFDNNGEYLIEPQLINPEQLSSVLSKHNLINDDNTIITGSGWMAYTEIFNQDVSLQNLQYVESSYPSAATMINLVLSGKSQPCAAHEAELLYLRNKVALNLEEQKQSKQ